MDLAWLTSALSLLTPLAAAVGTLLILLLIFRLLRRRLRARAFGVIYLGAALLLALALALDGEGLLPPGWPRGLLLATLLVAWGYLLFDLLEELLVEGALRRRGLPVPRLARDIVRGMIIIALVLLALNRVFGVPLSSLVISSTVASAVIGLALQDLLKNVIAGIALQAERPFAPGDWVQLRDQPLKVQEMSWRATRMVNVDNTHIIVPNANLATAEISNFTIISPVQALHVQIPLAPEHPPNQVKAVLTAAAQAAEGVLSDPPPGARLIAIGEYSATYDIKFWMQGFDRFVETRDAVMTSAWYHIRRAGFRMPYPAREVFLHESDARRAAEVAQATTRRMAAELRAVELFGGLSDEERLELAARSELRLFAAGEVLVRQGDLDDTLYVICRGAARVEVAPTPGAPPVPVSTLAAGDFFGELALLTGSPRRATVVATADSEAMLVRREAIAPLLGRNPALPEILSAALEQRVANTQRAIAGAAENGATNGAGDLSQPGLLRRIRSLFGIE